MKLIAIYPPLRKGQRVQCSECGRMTHEVKADIDGPAFSFVCSLCEEDAQPEPTGDTPSWRRNEARVLRRLK